MKRTLLCALCLTACASTPSTGASGIPQSGWCSLSEPVWASAARDFNRAATLEVLAAIRTLVDTDRSLVKAGQKSDVGSQLDEIYKTMRPTGFVSDGVAQLGVRLRQLDCAVRAGKVEYQTAITRYDEIANLLGAEQATLEPGSAGPRAVSP